MTNSLSVSINREMHHGWKQPSLLLTANTFVFGCFVGMIMVLVPLYMYANGFDIAEIGLVVAAQAVFQLGLRIVSGVISDRYGEPHVITAGYASMLVSALLFATSSTLWPLIFAQLFTGASRAAYMPASKSYASRIHEENAAVHLGRTLGGATLGSIAGPAIGGLLAATVGFTGAFLVAAGVSGAGLVLSLLLPALPRHHAQTMRAAIASVPALLCTKATLLPGLIALFVASSIAVMASVGVIFLREGVSSESTVGLIMGTYATGASVSSFGFAKIFKRIGSQGTFALLFAVMGLGMVAIAMTGNTLLWTVLAMLFGVGMGLGAALYGLITANNSQPQERGVAMSIAGLYWATGMLIGPMLYGTLAEMIGTANALTVAGAFPIALALLTPIVFATLSPKPVGETDIA